MKKLLGRIKARFTQRRDNDRGPGSGRPADEVALHEDAQGKVMAERVQAGPFRSI